MKLATEAHHHRVAEAGKLQLDRAHVERTARDRHVVDRRVGEAGQHHSQGVAAARDAGQLERTLGIRLPEGLATRKKRLATIQAAMKRLEERQMAADQEAGRESGDDKPGSGKKRPAVQTPHG